MKWGVALIVLLGLVAALFAAIMVRSLLMSDSSKKSSTQIEAVLAVADMPPMTVVTSAHIEKRAVPKDKLPAGYLTDPSQAIGRILGMAVHEGQALTTGCFIENGTGAQVAASLPEGMRAIPVIISSNQIKGGLLYPGSVVDVLTAFKLSGNSRGEALSTTLLSDIQVLAVHGTSVAAKGSETEAGKGSRPVRDTGSLTVTLMVTPRQAEALQLATTYGTLALALRNPLDKKPVDAEPTVLSEGRLAQAGSAMPTSVDANESPTTVVENPLEKIFGPGPAPGQEKTQMAPPPKSSWPVTVIRGQAVKQEDVKLPEEG